MKIPSVIKGLFSKGSYTAPVDNANKAGIDTKGRKVANSGDQSKKLTDGVAANDKQQPRKISAQQMPSEWDHIKEENIYESMVDHFHMITNDGHNLKEGKDPLDLILADVVSTAGDYITGEKINAFNSKINSQYNLTEEQSKELGKALRKNLTSEKDTYFKTKGFDTTKAAPSNLHAQFTSFLNTKLKDTQKRILNVGAPLDTIDPDALRIARDGIKIPPGATDEVKQTLEQTANLVAQRKATADRLLISVYNCCVEERNVNGVDSKHTQKIDTILAGYRTELSASLSAKAEQIISDFVEKNGLEKTQKEEVSQVKENDSKVLDVAEKPSAINPLKDSPLEVKVADIDISTPKTSNPLQDKPFVVKAPKIDINEPTVEDKIVDSISVKPEKDESIVKKRIKFYNALSR